MNLLHCSGHRYCRGVAHLVAESKSRVRRRGAVVGERKKEVRGPEAMFARLKYVVDVDGVIGGESGAGSGGDKK